MTLQNRLPLQHLVACLEGVQLTCTGSCACCADVGTLQQQHVLQPPLICRLHTTPGNVSSMGLTC